MEIRYTLLSDGSSDRALLPILNWLLEKHRQASELSSRRLRSFSASDCTHRVAELINDFSPLRALPAFAALETELKEVIAGESWEPY